MAWGGEGASVDRDVGIAADPWGYQTPSGDILRVPWKEI